MPWLHPVDIKNPNDPSLDPPVGRIVDSQNQPDLSPGNLTSPPGQLPKTESMRRSSPSTK